MKLKEIINNLLLVVFAIAVFTLVYYPLEYQITEVWMITPKILPIIGSIFLLSLVVLLVAVGGKELVQKKAFLIVLIILTILSGVIYQTFRRSKLSREYLPKIYKVESRWGIQAQELKIIGVNFGPVWKKGSVVVGGNELLIREWDEKFIIGEHQVPKGFGKVDLYVIREDGVVSNKVRFEIKNPDFLITR